MSRQFLQSLNGNNRGHLYDFLEHSQGEPRIAWYPSAGSDFRALMYLDASYAAYAPAVGPEPSPPDIFLFTDYDSSRVEKLVASTIIYEDEFTSVRIDHAEELPQLNLTYSEEIIRVWRKPPSNRVFFLTVTVTSTILGTLVRPVIYAITENQTFFCETMHPNSVRLSHMINVRNVGSGSSGKWMLNVLRQVGCEVFIADGHLGLYSRSRTTFPYCHAVPAESDAHLHPIRMIPGVRWSDHGDVTWNLLVNRHELVDARASLRDKRGSQTQKPNDKPSVPIVIGSTMPDYIVVCSTASLILEMATGQHAQENLASLPADNPVSEQIIRTWDICDQPDLLEFWTTHYAAMDVRPVELDYYMEHTKTRRFRPFALDSRLNIIVRLVRWYRTKTYRPDVFRRSTLGRYHADHSLSEPHVTFVDHNAFMDVFVNYVAGDSIEGHDLSPWFKEFETYISTRKGRIGVLFLEDLNTADFVAMEKFQRRYNKQESHPPANTTDDLGLSIYYYYGLPPGVPAM